MLQYIPGGFDYLSPIKTRPWQLTYPEQIMAAGWLPDGAVQDQIDANVDDTAERARKESGSGQSARLSSKTARPEARRPHQASATHRVFTFVPSIT